MGSNQDANEFPHDHTIMLIQHLKVGNYIQIVGPVVATHIGKFLFPLVATEPQPFNRHLKPLGKRAHFVLRWNCFADQPFACGMHGNGRAGKTGIEFTRQFRGAVVGMLCISQRFLKPLTKAFSFIRNFCHY
jgi:hypothetical protein